MFARFADFVFPSACAGCGRIGTPLCPSCLPAPNASRRLRFESLVVTAAGPYAGPLRKTILAYKHGRRDAGDVLASFLAARAGARIGPSSVLVPVPTLARRRRERGFDQSVRLAALTSLVTGHPVLVALAQRAGDAQRGRSRSARLRARGRFVCTAPQLVRGVNVVLVDDVITTGATLRDCARALQEVGAVVNEAIVLAYA